MLLQVRQCCEEKMVAAHVTWLHAEADTMIENERRKDLSLLYPLLRPLPAGLVPLVQKLTHHITQEGLQAIGPLQGDNVCFFVKFVAKILDQNVKIFWYFSDPYFICRKYIGSTHKVLVHDKGSVQRRSGVHRCFR